ncbi:MAG TPA: lmo0937 family membrane protein [Patescibacteria group bacterium]|nr:lmo0937 family membrane protein [Patescibacteria group bacterium]
MGLLELIVAVLVIAWLGGFAFHVAGNLIHLLLVLAIIIIAIRFIRGTV